MIATTEQMEEDGNTPFLSAADANGDSIERLRQILAKRQLRHVVYNEAREIGDSLIEFYQVLAEEICDEPAA